MAESLTSRSTFSSRLRTHSAWWLLARHSDSQTEVLTVTPEGYEMLLVCAGVRSVAIDPLPSVLSDEVAEPVGLDRERFVNRLVRGGT